MRTQRLGFLLAITAAFVWSFTGPGIAYLLDTYHVPRLTIAFWRDLFCMLVLLPVALARFGLPSRADLLQLGAAGVLFIGVYHALWVFSVGYNGPAVAVVLIYTFPSFATLGAWLLWREQPSRAAIAGLILAFIGCALVVRVYDPQVLSVQWVGIACGIGTGIAQAGYSLFSQRALRNHHPWTTLAWLMAFGTFALLLTQRPATILAVGSTAWPWLVVLGLAVGPTLGGYVLYTLALRSLPAGVAGTVVTLEAPFAALLSAAVLGQRLGWPQVVGLVLILLGAVLPQLRAWHQARRELSRGTLHPFEP